MLAASHDSLPERTAGGTLRAAAVDSAFRRFGGEVTLDGAPRPAAVSVMALIFDSVATATHTFAQVAEAAHLKTQVDGCDVAVETVTGSGGLVSYWGFVHRDEAIVILTLDTVDPQDVSVSDLRALVVAAGRRLQSVTQER